MSVAVEPVDIHPSTVVTLRPPDRWASLRLGDLWEYRELLYFLTKREILIRYKQSFFGIGWAVLQPIAMAMIFYVFFGRLAGVGSEGVPYPVFALVALVPWTFASVGVAAAAGSLVGEQNLLSKVYFPRLVVPFARVLALMVDLCISFAVLAVFMLAYGLTPEPTVILVPLFLLLAFMTTVGVGTYLAALNVKYRDVGVAMPLVVQLWLFATPVVYPGSLVSGVWEYVYALNPMSSVITGMRWAVLGTESPNLAAVAISLATAVLVLLAALVYFRRTESYFADVI